jgi:hypothetical protein
VRVRSVRFKDVTAFTVSPRRRPAPLPAREKGRRESQERFEERQARRKLIEEAEVSVEIIDGREWTVRKLGDSYD